jgi:hypothetical protein
MPQKLISVHLSPILLICLGLTFGCSKRIPIQTTDNLAPEIRNEIDAIVRDAKIVAFGESSHYLNGLHVIGTETFKYLVEKHGFRVFLLETFWAIDEVLNPFINSDREELTAEERFYLNAFNSKHTRDLLLYMREFNRGNPSDPIVIAGFQPEQPWSDVSNILQLSSGLPGEYIPDGYLLSLKNSVFNSEAIQSDLGAVVFASSKRKAGINVLQRQEFDLLIEAVGKISESLENKKPNIEGYIGKESTTNLITALISLNSYLHFHIGVLDAYFFGTSDNLEDVNTSRITNQFYHDVDSVKFDVFKNLYSTRYAGKKVFIWMHNWHAAKNTRYTGGVGSSIPIMGAHSVGTRLSEFYGDDYKVIGSIVALPDVEYSRSGIHLEDLLFQKFPQDTILINLNKIKQRYMDLNLDSKKYSFIEQGARQILTGFIMADQFDGIFFLPQSGFVNGN